MPICTPVCLSGRVRECPTDPGIYRYKRGEEGRERRMEGFSPPNLEKELRRLMVVRHGICHFICTNAQLGDIHIRRPHRGGDSQKADDRLCDHDSDKGRGGLKSQKLCGRHLLQCAVPLQS